MYLTSKEAASQNQTSSPRFLIVDDDKVDHILNAFILEKIYQDTTIIIDTVYSGIDAITNCLDHKYDMILMDYNMPGMNGVITAQALRTNPIFTSYSKIPIVIVSSINLENTVTHAKESDSKISEWFEKPLRENELKQFLINHGLLKFS